MKKSLLIIFSIFLVLTGFSQVTTVPALPTESDEVTVTFDAAQGSKGLMGFTGEVYAHTGVITDKSSSNSDWKYTVSAWGVNIAKAKLTSLGNDKWSFKLTPNIRAFYGVPAGEKIVKIAFVFRSGVPSSGTTYLEGKGTGGTDIFQTVYTAGVTVSITAPIKGTIFSSGSAVAAEVNVSNATKLDIYLDNALRTTNSGTQYTESITGLPQGNHALKAIATASDGTLAKDSSTFLIAQAPTTAALPAGMRPGINYTSDNAVCLVLYAPLKQNAYVIGDFNNWLPNANYQMNVTPDGKTYWLNITGLTKGTEYGFQYLVDGIIKIPDPYTEKVLDPGNDQYIPAATYPNLKAYPTDKTTGLVSVLQTGQTAYNWQVTNFTPPSNEKLVIYELLVRDFTDTHNYQGIIDKLTYLKNLGVNVLELMPINEFDGNLSWGYNPALYFAPDKYYGPKDQLKSLVDECHKQGIAVVLDQVLNHSFNNSPFAQLYWDATNGRPAANNPWYNVTSPNTAYSWGNDFNHESTDTKALIDSVASFWMKQYHVDGFRFDFTKGFTNTPGDGSAYDASRIAILKRMGTEIWKRNAKAYVILEHFAANTEETELSAAGLMIWGNVNYNYCEASMGYTATSDISSVSYKSRGWTNPNLVGYMESHDEERQVYKDITYGNLSGSYSTKTLTTALKRAALTASFFFTIPGPKMIWQFGELGYDYSINTCGDLTVNSNCRTDAKPIKWDYYTDPNRLALYNTYSQLIKLKQSYPVFSATDFTTILTGAQKSIVLRKDASYAVVVGNFDIASGNNTVTFPSTGTYYEYFTQQTLNATSTTQTFTLQPGEYRIYTNFTTTGIEDTPTAPTNAFNLSIYPNPSNGDTSLEVSSTKGGDTSIEVFAMTGQKVASSILALLANTTAKTNLKDIGLSRPSPGVYLVKIQQGARIMSQRLVIR